ncbi:MAG: hydrogenase expression/formation protein HypE [Planctomycetes bacterium]|nr:hydrogenase expression/formation protein HypE [Planctomycetota bacterium]
MSRSLIRDQILRRLGNDTLLRLEDSATLMLPSPDDEASTALAFTTDGYTVSPLFFPGGDIGKLAVFGTVNDLAVTGARPLWLSLAMIIEEGLPVSLLNQVLDSIRDAAVTAHVQIVTGDTKVVPRGMTDKLYVTTSGIGVRCHSAPTGAATLQPDDEIIVSGPIGCHGAAVLCSREQFDFDPLPHSDCAPLTEPLMALISAGLTPRAVRDATRGGVAAVLHEWTEMSRTRCMLVEDQIPVTASVRAVCELLGLDAIHLANEGTCLLATPSHLVQPTLALLRQFPITQSAAAIGRVAVSRRPAVTMVRVSGREVAIDEPSGAPLPRIC